VPIEKNIASMCRQREAVFYNPLYCVGNENGKKLTLFEKYFFARVGWAKFAAFLSPQSVGSENRKMATLSENYFSETGIKAILIMTF